MALRDTPAGFWLGVGMVAEAPVMLIIWLLPESCDAFLNRLMGCPPSIWIILLICIVSYVSVAWAGYKLGFAE
jgi:hypothetical protein